MLMQIAEGALAIPPTAFGALGALGVVGAALFVADPEKRCLWPCCHLSKDWLPLNHRFSSWLLLLTTTSRERELWPFSDAVQTCS